MKPNGEIVFQHESDEMTTNSDPRLAFAQEYGDNPSEVRYKFDASSTTDEVLHGLDLSNKIAIVTGANTGIGMFSYQVIVCSINRKNENYINFVIPPIYVRQLQNRKEILHFLC